MSTCKYIRENLNSNSDTNPVARTDNAGLITLSVSPSLVTPIDGSRPTGDHITFEAARCDEKQFVTLLKTGKAISISTYTGNNRHKQNFRALGLLVADYDNGTPLADILELPLVARYALAIRESKSHTPEHPRYHVFFALATPITEVPAAESAAVAFNAYFENSDRATKDVARLFYGSYGQIVHYNPNARLPGEVLARLVSDHNKDAQQPAPPRPATDVGSRYSSGKPLLDIAYRLIAGESEGNQNERLNAEIYSLARKHAGGRLPGVSIDDIRQMAMAASEANGYIARDGLAQTKATIESAINGGLKKPDYGQVSNISNAYDNLRLQTRKQPRPDVLSQAETAIQPALYTFDGGGLPVPIIHTINRFTEKKWIKGQWPALACIGVILKAVDAGQLSPGDEITRPSFSKLADRMGVHLTAHTVKTGLAQLHGLKWLSCENCTPPNSAKNAGENDGVGSCENCTHITNLYTGAKIATEGENPSRKPVSYHLCGIQSAMAGLKDALTNVISTVMGDYLPDDTLASWEGVAVSDPQTYQDVQDAYDSLDILTDFEKLATARQWHIDASVTNATTARRAFISSSFDAESVDNERVVYRNEAAQMYGCSVRTYDTDRRALNIATKENYEFHRLNTGSAVASQVKTQTKGQKHGLAIRIGVSGKWQYITPDNRDKVFHAAESAMKGGQIATLRRQLASIEYQTTPDEIETIRQARSEQQARAKARRENEKAIESELADVATDENVCESEKPPELTPPETPDVIGNDYSESYLFWHVKAVIEYEDNAEKIAGLLARGNKPTIRLLDRLQLTDYTRWLAGETHIKPTTEIVQPAPVVQQPVKKVITIDELLDAPAGAYTPVAPVWR